MSEKDFEKLRARGLKVISATKPRRLPKARQVQAPTRGPQPASIIYIPKAAPADDAQHTVKAVPGRIMALDLSTAKTGLAWGRAGEKPEGTLLLHAGPQDKDEPEGQRLLSMAREVAWHVGAKQCGFVIFTEFYSALGGRTTRTLHSLRGAVMAELARYGIDALPVAEITVRKAAGVDISRGKDQPKGWMKARVRARLEQLGLGHLQEDQGDAAILLLGCKDLVEIGAIDGKA